MTRNESAVHDDMLRRIRNAEAKGLLPRPSERRAAPGSSVLLLIAAIIWGVISFAAGMALGAPPCCVLCVMPPPVQESRPTGLL